MAVSSTLLSFSFANQNLWGPGAAIELGVDTGDSLIWDPEELTYDFEIGGSFLGVSAQVYLDAKIGLFAYAKIGEVGRFDGGIDIAVDVGHSAVVLGGQNISFDFSSYEVSHAELESTGFSVGPKAGLDLILGFQFGLRDISYSVFGISGDAGSVSIINVDQTITLFSVGPGDLELPFDLGYGLELTLRVPSGANTQGSSTSPIVRSDGFSDSPFLQLSADLDELLTSLLKKVPFPPAAAVANVLENTIFATFEFDLNDYIPGIDKGIFGIEATVLDIGATIGATVSEQLGLDFSNGDGKTPDVFITLRSDNGTVGDLSDDQTQTAKLGDSNVLIQGPGYEGLGPVTVTATYSMASPRFSHNIGIDLVGSFTIEALKAATTGYIGEKLGVTFGPLLSLEFPEGGFRLNVIPSVYSNSFDVAPNVMDSQVETYQIFYSSTAPQGLVDFDKPGVVQELIAYNEIRQINIAASNATFAAVNGTRVAAAYDFTNGFFINTSAAQFATFRFDVAPVVPGAQAVGNADMQGNLRVNLRDVVNVDAFNTAGVPLSELSARFEINGLSTNFPQSGFLDAESATSNSGYIFLNALPVPANMHVGGPGGIAEGTVLTYRYAGVNFRTENSVNILGNSRDDLLVYWGDEARLIDGGGHQAGSATGDVLVANFARSHGLDAIEWDLRPTSGGAQAVGGDGVKLKLSRGSALYDVDATALEAQGYQAVAGKPGALEISPLDSDGIGLLRTQAGAFSLAGTFVLRLRVEDTANGASSFEVRVVDGANALVRSLGSFVTNKIRPGELGGYSDIAIKDVVLAAGQKIEIVTTRGNATGDLAEAARISRLQLHEQHEVNFLNIESFVLSTSGMADVIFTSTFRDGITFNGGDDTLFLTADAHSEDMDMGTGGDIALIEMKTAAQTGGGSATDRVFGQTGADEAILRNLSDTGLTWALRTPDPSLGTGLFISAVLTNASSKAVLEEAARGLAFLWTDDLRSSRDVSMPNSTLPSYYIEARLTEGGLTRAVDLVNFEAISVEGSDTADDLAFYLGGGTYDGGASVADTFVANFSIFDQVAGQERGVVISGYNSDLGLPDPLIDVSRTTFSYDSGLSFARGSRFRTSEIKGFERLIVTGTAQGDVLIGGAYDDLLVGRDGDDILVGGGSFSTTFVNGKFALGLANELYGGAGNDTFHVTGGERSLIDPNEADGSVERLNFGPGILADDAVVSFFGLTLHGLRQVFRGIGPGGTSVTFGAGDQALALLGAAGQIELASRDFIFESTAGLGAFVSGRVRTNLTGLDGTDDLFIADGGATYIGGERLGDGDTFVADFSGQKIGLTWNVEQDVAGVTLSNGLYLSGMDRIVVQLGDGANVVTGGRLDDLIRGGAGSDVLRGGGALGADTLEGGAGADLFGWNADDGNAFLDGGSDVGDLETEVIDRLLVSAVGPDGAALVASGFAANFYSGAFAQMLAPVGAGSATNLLETLYYLLDDGLDLRIFAGDNFVTTTRIEAVDVQGSNAHDDLVVYRGGSFHDGGERAGDADIFMADFGAETRRLTILARAGEDRLADATGLTDIGNGVQLSNFERLFVRTGSGADQITGGDFGDLIEAGGGEDLVDGGAGNDQLFGGEGKDVLFYASGLDHIHGGEGIDILEMGAVPGGTQAIWGRIGSNFEFFADVGDITTAASARAELAGFMPQAGLFAQTYLISSNGTGVFYDGIEKVIASAEEARDILISGIEGGILSGDGGDDVLIGLGGNDLLVGGAGLDRYALHGAWGQDVIGGEYSGTGEIHFFGWTRAQITFSLQGGDDLMMRAAGGQSLLFLDYFANGANGLAYVFGFDDQTVALDLTGLGAVSTGAIATGEIYFGTSGRDEIFDGTSGSDSYFAREGNDLIAGSAGPDIISGGLGVDAVLYQTMVVANAEALGVTVNLDTGFGLRGDAAGDLLISIEDVLGSDGRDSLTGSDRRNALAGGEGRDTVYGGAGNDFLSGDAGNDRLYGGDDDDLILGGTGSDTLEGGIGNDYLNGGAETDLLLGQDGDDTGVGGNGNDTADLGQGNDTWMIVPGDLGTDTVEGGTGEDTIELSALDRRATLTLGGPVDGPQSVFTDHLAASLTGFEHAIGSNFGDALIGDSRGNILMGLGGSDLIAGHGGADTLDGGAGFDRLDYGAEGGGGRVIVDLATGFVTDTYGNTDRVVNFEHVVGTNFITTGLDADDLLGDAGDNTFTGNKGIDVDLIDGRAGIDTVDYSVESDTQNYLPGTATPGPVGQGIVVDLGLAGSFAVPNATDTSGHGDLLVNIENVIGSIRGDFVRGSAGDNMMVGGDGEDTLIGEAGFDTVDYGAESGQLGVVIDETGTILDTFGKRDVLLGIERIIGTTRADVFTLQDSFTREIVMGDGADSLVMLGGHAEVSNSRFFGGAGDDTMQGSEGAEFFFGGADNNLAIGNGGNDVYLSSGGFDTFFGGQGEDIVNFELLTEAVTVSIGLGEAYADFSRILSFADVSGVVGSRFGDGLTGDGAANAISGGEGNDTITGGDGADTLYGGAGRDTVEFGPGLGLRIDLTLASANVIDEFGQADTLRDFEVFVLGQGSDSMKGDAEAQTVIFTGGNDSLDAGAGFDTADFSRQFQTLSVSMVFDSVTGITTGTVATSAELVVLSGVEHVIGGNGEFDDIYGGDGNDVFTGNMGIAVDLISGNLGIDTIDYGSETGSQGVVVNLGAPAPDIGAPNAFDTHGHGDLLLGIEVVIGSAHGDQISGGTGNDSFYGQAGNDTLAGAEGDDLLIGGAGIDVATYAAETGALGLITEVGGGYWWVRDSQGGLDMLNLIENLVGTARADRILATSEANVITAGDGADTVDGGQGNDTLLGQSGADSLLGFTGDDSLIGASGIDTLRGEEGDDTLRGGSGGDVIEGGAGKDAASYADSGLGVTVTLLDGAGLGLGGDAAGDLLSGIEDLVGSTKNDSLTGDDFANWLTGNAGADTLTGGKGNDVYVVDALDLLVEEVNGGRDEVRSTGAITLLANFEDAMLTGLGNVGLTGNSQGNTLIGNVGNNQLQGLGGADTLRGGAGNDTYVTEIFDTLIELADEGIDTVRIAASYVLSEHFENLTLTGTGAFEATGNAKANDLRGNAAANRLDGVTGADTMRGGNGDDIYVTDGDDLLIETLTGGRDLVLSSVTLTLAANIEDLTLTGTAGLTGRGNLLANRLIGNGGANILAGGQGLDTLTGGGGADGFIFNTTLGAGNVDQITDFVQGEDKIRLDDLIFSGLAPGALDPAAFTTGALAARSMVIYEQASGSVFYDADGSGNGARQLFAQVTAGLALTASDFTVI